MSEEHTVLVDMDGVLADFESPNNEIVKAYGLEPVQNRTDFYYADSYSDDPGLQDIIYRENRKPGFFRNFPVVEGATEGWQRILSAGFTPRVCSSPLENHPTVITEKKEWLEEHFAGLFGYWVVDTAIFDRDKSGYDASAMIDDRPVVRGADNARWQHIMFSQSYNAHVDSDLRLDGWGDPKLQALLWQCQMQYRAQL